MTSTSKLKKELDRVFSLYIRGQYPSKCYTCGKRTKNLHCGHFVSRGYLATRWDEDNCRPQCIGDNLFAGGRPLDFEENLRKELGNKRVDELKMRRHNIVKLTPQWYQEKIKHYKQAIKDFGKQA